MRPDALGVTDPFIDAARIRLETLARDYPVTLALLDAISSEAVENSQLNYWPKDLVYAWTYGFMGDEAKAREHYDTARALLEEKIEATPEDERLYSAIGLAYAGLGRKEDAIRAGQRGVELLPIDKEAWRGAYRVAELAMIYAIVGEQDLAINQIEHLLSRPGDLSIALLKLDPIWDPLRDHARFRQLITE